MKNFIFFFAYIIMIGNVAWASCVHEPGSVEQIFLTEGDLNSLNKGYAIHICPASHFHEVDVSLMLRPPRKLIEEKYNDIRWDYETLKSELEFRDKIFKYGIPSKQHIKNVIIGD